jgi:prolyl oligopeptidase
MSTVARSTAFALLLIPVMGCGSDTATARLPYPPARTVNVVDDYHGTKVADPYRWLEDLQSQEVRDWAAAQTAVALPFLRQNDVRPWALARVAELRKFWEEPQSGDDDPPLIDESTLGAGKTLSDVWPSPDRAFAAYAVSDQGSEWVETRIRRLADGKDLDERLEGLFWSDAAWTKDSRGFFYVRSRKPAAGDLTAMKGPALYYHVAGTPQAQDLALFQTPPDVTDLVLEHHMSEDGRFLFLYEGNGAHVDSIGWLLTRMYVLDLGNPRRPAVSNRLVPLTANRDAAYRVIATEGDTLYVFTDRDAPRRRVVALNARKPSPDQWRDVVPQSDDVLDEVFDVDGDFVVTYLRNAQHGARVFDRTGRLIRELPTPPMSSVSSVRPGPGKHEVAIGVMEGGLAPARTRYNLKTGTSMVERAPKLPFPADTYEFKQVWYASKDGVRVPMFVVHRRGMALNGANPALLVGYGASSQLTTPWLGDWGIVALELGMVVAMPVLRGGGELGRQWYEAAILEKKQTTFDDFIAAAEFLIRERYTSSEKLAIQGGSNGGLLVTAVINQRPDLFRVAVAEVPQSESLRYDRGRHATQFGSAANPAHFPFLYAYSPQHNVKPGTCYPSTLITTALNDDRAPAWMALKYTATLQAGQSCPRPVILRAPPGGGHAGNVDEDAADVMAFVAGQLGITSPKSGGARQELP